MEPIINPWWIYLAEKSENLGDSLCIIGILIAIGCGVVLLFGIIEEGEIIKIPKFILVFAIIFILIGSLLPNQKTILTMMTVQQLTPNNIKIVGNTVEDTIDYIVEKVDDLIDENDK